MPYEFAYGIHKLAFFAQFIEKFLATVITQYRIPLGDIFTFCIIGHEIIIAWFFGNKVELKIGIVLLQKVYHFVGITPSTPRIES